MTAPPMSVDPTGCAPLNERIALFIRGYRLARGDPSLTQAAVLRAFPGSTGGDYAIGLITANRATASGSK